MASIIKLNKWTPFSWCVSHHQQGGVWKVSFRSGSFTLQEGGSVRWNRWKLQPRFDLVQCQAGRFCMFLWLQAVEVHPGVTGRGGWRGGKATLEKSRWAARHCWGRFGGTTAPWPSCGHRRRSQPPRLPGSSFPAPWRAAPQRLVQVLGRLLGECLRNASFLDQDAAPSTRHTTPGLGPGAENRVRASAERRVNLLGGSDTPTRIPPSVPCRSLSAWRGSGLQRLFLLRPLWFLSAGCVGPAGTVPLVTALPAKFMDVGSI